MANNNDNNISEQSNNEQSNSAQETNNSNQNTSEETYQELQIYDLSLLGLYIVLIAIIINIEFILINKGKTLDDLNNTNYYDLIGDISDTPKLTNRLYLFATAIFLIIIYGSYIAELSGYDGDLTSYRNLYKAKLNLAAIIFIFIGSIINFISLNKV